MNAVLLEALRAARRIVFFTGAGVSAESGVPTFRDRQTGLWERYDALQLATPEAFERDPALVWGWYEWRRMLVRRAQPNAAHRAIAAFARAGTTTTLITQNVDDLHERGGSDPVTHLHGRLFASLCSICRHPHEDIEMPRDMPEGGRHCEPPRCAACGGRVRPGVVWFGESLPSEEWRKARHAAQHCEVFFCIGTASMVQPAASLTALAHQAGAFTVQVNPQPTAADSQVDLVLRGNAGALVPEVLRAGS